MNRQQIDLLRQHPELKDAAFVETHISWLILTSDKVYKMKKEVQFSFLDFSTLARRKQYCERELMLNQRLAPDLYEDVVAINPAGGGLQFGHYQPNSVGYAIRMRRVDEKWEMAGMLRRGEVSFKHLDQLADQLAAFHQQAKPEQSLFNPIKALDEFSDIRNFANLLTPHIGAAEMSKVIDAISTARVFLREHHRRFHYRRVQGLTVDGHGDLHASNVFLENDKPLIFDCIEFNDEFRMVDVLDEVAFLCVDLEAAGSVGLAERFAASYQAANRTILIEEDEHLFDFYKCYRANVRLKVTAIKLSNLPTEAHAEEQIAQLHRYLKVFHKYAARLLPQPSH